MTVSLTPERVVSMRESRATGTTLVQLAATYGVTFQTVWHITAGRSWPHVGGPIATPRHNGICPADCPCMDVDEVAVQRALAEARAGRKVSGRLTKAERRAVGAQLPCTVASRARGVNGVTWRKARSA